MSPRFEHLFLTSFVVINYVISLARFANVSDAELCKEIRGFVEKYQIVNSHKMRLFEALMNTSAKETRRYPRLLEDFHETDADLQNMAAHLKEVADDWFAGEVANYPEESISEEERSQWPTIPEPLRKG